MKTYYASLRYFVYVMVTVSMLFGLVGCESVPVYVVNPTVSNLTKTERELLADIAHSGIQIIKQGMIFTFVIPTDAFFAGPQHALKSNREIDLDRLAEFLHSYSAYFAKPKIYVVGHTDKVWLAPARDLLSMHYAETVATYFREDGLGSSGMVMPIGEGAKNPIASNQYPMGTAFNRRVVVIIEG